MISGMAPETQDTPPPPLPDDERQMVRSSVGLIAGLVALLLAAAALIPMDEGVPAQGLVIVESHRKTIQHPQGGVVEEIAVREGQQVEAGQTLLRLNARQAQADNAAIRAQYFVVRAAVLRLQAEQARLKQLLFPPELTQAPELEIQAAVAAQTRLFQERRQALEAEIGVLRQTLAQLEAQLQGQKAVAASKGEQAQSLEKQLVGMRAMSEEGYLPRNRTAEMERSFAETQAGRDEARANIERTLKAAAETRQRITLRLADFDKEVATQLADLQRELASLEEKRLVGQDVLQRSVIKAPVAGMVVGLSAHTIGGVVTPGSKIMDIAPLHEQWIVEGRVAPQLIDRVQPGLKVDVRFEAFNQATTPVSEGEILSVSADVVTDPANNQTYYLTRVGITQEGMRRLGENHPQAGMPVSIIVKTGSRPWLSYLLKPLLSRVSGAMLER
jgi:protease secretion system membrane fusion protein